MGTIVGGVFWGAFLIGAVGLVGLFKIGRLQIGGSSPSSAASSSSAPTVTQYPMIGATSATSAPAHVGPAGRTGTQYPAAV